MYFNFNSLPNDKIIDWSELEAFSDEKINMTEKLIFVLRKVEKNLGIRENAGFQHFLFYPLWFQKAFFSGSLKVRIMW